jgi:hypothetical protein
VSWGFSFADSSAAGLHEADPDRRTIREVAELLGEKRSTVFRHYQLALAWLRDRLPEYSAGL